MSQERITSEMALVPELLEFNRDRFNIIGFTKKERAHGHVPFHVGHFVFVANTGWLQPRPAAVSDH
jgi:hypothetical protein